MERPSALPVRKGASAPLIQPTLTSTTFPDDSLAEFAEPNDLTLILNNSPLKLVGGDTRDDEEGLGSFMLRKLARSRSGREKVGDLLFIEAIKDDIRERESERIGEEDHLRRKLDDALSRSISLSSSTPNPHALRQSLARSIFAHQQPPAENTDSLFAELQASKLAHNELIAERDSFKTALSSTRQEIASLSNALGSLQSTALQTSAQHSSLEAEILQSQSSISQLQSTLASLQQESQRLSTLVSSTTASNSSLQQSLQDQITPAEQHNAELTARLKRITAENEKLTSQCLAAESQMDTLREQDAAIQAELQIFKDRYTQSLDSRAQVERECLEVEEVLESRLQAQMQAKQKLAEVDNEIAALSADRHGAADRLKQLQQQAIASSSQYEEQLQQLEATAQAKEREITKASFKIESLQKEVASINSRISQLQASVDERSQFVESLEDRQVELASSNMRIEASVAQLEGRQKQLLEHKQGLEDSVIALSDEYDGLASKYKQLQTAYSELEAESTKYQDVIQILESQNQEARDKIKQLEELEGDQALAITQLRNTSSRLAELERECNKLDEQFQIAQDSKVKSTEALAGILAEIDATRANLENMQILKESESTKLHKLRGEVWTIQQELEELAARKEQLSQQVIEQQTSAADQALSARHRDMTVPLNDTVPRQPSTSVNMSRPSSRASSRDEPRGRSTKVAHLGDRKVPSQPGFARPTQRSLSAASRPQSPKNDDMFARRQRDSSRHRGLELSTSFSGVPVNEQPEFAPRAPSRSGFAQPTAATLARQAEVAARKASAASKSRVNAPPAKPKRIVSAPVAMTSRPARPATSVETRKPVKKPGELTIPKSFNFSSSNKARDNLPAEPVEEERMYKRARTSTIVAPAMERERPVPSPPKSLVEISDEEDIHEPIRQPEKERRLTREALEFRLHKDDGAMETQEKVQRFLDTYEDIDVGPKMVSEDDIILPGAFDTSAGQSVSGRSSTAPVPPLLQHSKPPRASSRAPSVQSNRPKSVLMETSRNNQPVNKEKVLTVKSSVFDRLANAMPKHKEIAAGEKRKHRTK